MAGVRFTTWLDEDERALLRQTARENGCSENYVVRVILRAALLGKPMMLHIKKEKLTAQ